MTGNWGWSVAATDCWCVTAILDWSECKSVRMCEQHICDVREHCMEGPLWQNKRWNTKSVWEVNVDTDVAEEKMLLKIHEVKLKGGTMNDGEKTAEVFL